MRTTPALTGVASDTSSGVCPSFLANPAMVFLQAENCTPLLFSPEIRDWLLLPSNSNLRPGPNATISISILSHCLQKMALMPG